MKFTALEIEKILNATIDGDPSVEVTSLDKIEETEGETPEIPENNN